MASQGPQSPGTGADDAAVGTLTWSNPGNITSDNGVNAVASKTGAAALTHYLKATNFGFSIPSGATINGIEVIYNKFRGGAGTVSDSKVRIIKSDASIGTTEKAAGGAWSTSSTATTTYGGPADLWGETWADTDINDVDFGVALSASVSGSKAPGTANVDYVSITVYYTAAGVAAADSYIIQFN